MASTPLRDQNLEGLFNCPWFFGKLSRENATEILNEAVTNDGESLLKEIIFLETKLVTNPWSHDIGQNRLAIIQAIRRKGPEDIQPKFYFSEIIKSQWDYISGDDVWNWRFGNIQEWNVVRKNPFSLEVLAAVKAASCGFNLETQRLPRMIKEEVKKYQDLNERIKSYCLI